MSDPSLPAPETCLHNLHRAADRERDPPEATVEEERDVATARLSWRGTVLGSDRQRVSCPTELELNPLELR